MNLPAAAANLLSNQVARLPYPWLAGSARRWCGTRWYVSRFGRRYRRSLLEMQRSLDLDFDLTVALSHFLLRNSLKKMLIRKVAVTRKDRLPSLFPHSGFERVQQLHREGRKLIFLGSHFGSPRFFPLWVARLGIPVLSLEQRDLVQDIGFQRPDSLEIVEIDGKFPARSLFLANRALGEGRAVHLLGDGFQGAQRIALHFLGKERSFPSGFAELAVAHEAVVVPVFVPICPNGLPKIEFLEPITSSKPSGSAQNRVDDLVGQYSAVLENRWKVNPEGIEIKHLRKWLRGHSEAKRQLSKTRAMRSK